MPIFLHFRSASHCEFVVVEVVFTADKDNGYTIGQRQHTTEGVEFGFDSRIAIHLAVLASPGDGLVTSLEMLSERRTECRMFRLGTASIRYGTRSGTTRSFPCFLRSP